MAITLQEYINQNRGTGKSFKVLFSEYKSQTSPVQATQDGLMNGAYDVRNNYTPSQGAVPSPQIVNGRSTPPQQSQAINNMSDVAMSALAGAKSGIPTPQQQSQGLPPSIESLAPSLPGEQQYASNTSQPGMAMPTPPTLAVPDYSGIASNNMTTLDQLNQLLGRQSQVSNLLAGAVADQSSTAEEITRGVRERFNDNRALNDQANNARLAVLLGYNQIVEDVKNSGAFRNSDGTVNMAGVLAEADNRLSTKAKAAQSIIETRDVAQRTIDQLVEAGILGNQDRLKALGVVNDTLNSQLNTLLQSNQLANQAVEAQTQGATQYNQTAQQNFQNLMDLSKVDYANQMAQASTSATQLTPTDRYGLGQLYMVQNPQSESDIRYNQRVFNILANNNITDSNIINSLLEQARSERVGETSQLIQTSLADTLRERDKNIQEYETLANISEQVSKNPNNTQKILRANKITGAYPRQGTNQPDEYTLVDVADLNGRLARISDQISILNNRIAGLKTQASSMGINLEAFNT